MELKWEIKIYCADNELHRKTDEKRAGECEIEFKH
jgi:hypothetical protein